MAHKQPQSHVPRFGSWDGDDTTPYTAYFENARKEKAGPGVRINPNDPQQNPDAFIVMPRPQPSASTNSVFNSISHRRKISDSRRNKHSPVTNQRLNYSADDFACRTVSVPKFGEWDEKDPRSAEGFTVIFNRVKEEKQIAATELIRRGPATPLLTGKGDGGKMTGRDKATGSSFRWCCCLFWMKSKVRA